MNEFYKFISDWIWQLPQNLCGLIYKGIIKKDIVSCVNMNPKYQVYLKRSNGGVALGKYIFVYQKYTNLSKVIQHETGHVKQSRILGPLYLLVIGIPSLLHAYIHNNICKDLHYYHFYTESWANRLSGLKE